MPTETLENVLTQLQKMLVELYDNGRTTLAPEQIETLSRQVAYIQRDEGRRIAFGKAPKEVKWDEDYFDVVDVE